MASPKIGCGSAKTQVNLASALTLHNPCAYLKNKNLLYDRQKIASSDAKPSAIKFTWMAEVRSDGAASAEAKLVWTMPSRDRGRQSQGGRLVKLIYRIPLMWKHLRKLWTVVVMRTMLLMHNTLAFVWQTIALENQLRKGKSKIETKPFGTVKIITMIYLLVCQWQAQKIQETNGIIRWPQVLQRRRLLSVVFSMSLPRHKGTNIFSKHNNLWTKFSHF